MIDDIKSNVSDIIRDDAIYKIEQYRDKITATYSSNYNGKKKKPSIRRLNTDEYLVYSTGEVKEYKKDRKTKDVSAVIRSLKKAARIIEYNLAYYKKARFITLTYKENMTDTDRLQKDFERMIRSLRRKYKDNTIEYIYFPEPQERGAWHIHAVLFFATDKISAIEKNVEKIWNHGCSKTEVIRDAQRLICYLTDTFCFRSVKADRLDKYPPNLKVYKKSAGLKIPPNEYKTGAEIKQLVKDMNVVDIRNYSKQAANGYIIHNTVMRFESK